MKRSKRKTPEIESEMRESLEEYNQIFHNNKKWVESSVEKDPDFFLRRAKEQTPRYLFIGCSDSRVPAEQITGLEPGQLFVHRNIANMVVNTDLSCLSVIQFAIEVLKVKHIIVCGHYGCGGVEKSLENNDLGLIENWLRNIRDVQRLHLDELEAIEDPKAKRRRLVELNVQEQCINLLKTNFVQNRLEETENAFPMIHGWVYELKEGLLKELPIDFAQQQKKFRKIYRLNPLKDWMK
eukprot:gene8571-396_t